MIGFCKYRMWWSVWENEGFTVVVLLYYFILINSRRPNTLQVRGGRNIIYWNIECR